MTAVSSTFLAPGEEAAFLARLKSDFWFFVQAVWLDRGKDRVAPLGDIDEDVCNFAAHGPSMRQILAWRQFGKTHEISVTLVLWLLLRDPTTQILIVSKSGPQALAIIHLIREWLGAIWFLSHLAPYEGSGLRDTTTHFDVVGGDPAKDPSVFAKGIDGQITGTRCHWLIVDDMEDDKNCMTVSSRENLFRKTEQFPIIVYADVGQIIIIGTYQHESESIYMKLPAVGYTCRTWPIVYPAPNEQVEGLAPILARRLATGNAKPGEIVAPYRVTRNYVNKFQSRPTFFRLQGLLQKNVRATNRYPLSLKDLIVWESGRDSGPLEIAWGMSTAGTSTAIDGVDMAGQAGDRLYAPILVAGQKEWAKYHKTIMWVDPSGTGEDRVGVAVGSSLNGYIYIHQVEGLEGGSSIENATKIARMAYEHRVRTIYVEDNYNGQAVASLLQVELNKIARPAGSEDCPEGWGCSTELRHSVGQKEKRIIGHMEAVLAPHRLVMSLRAASNPRFQRQLAWITTEPGCLGHEDELEAVAALCNELSDTLAIDPWKAKAATEIDRQAAFLAQYRQVPQVEGSWITHH